MPGPAVTVYMFHADPELEPHELPVFVDGVDVDKRYLKRGQGRTLYGKAFPDLCGIGLWSLSSDQVEMHRNGEVTLETLAGDLALGTYFRFFDDGVVAMVPAGHGPRTMALSSYLKDCIGAPEVIFNAIVRTETGAFVASLDEIRRIELGVQAGSVELLNAVDPSLGAAIEGVTRATGTRRFKLVLEGSDDEERDAVWSRLRHPIAALSEREDLHLLRRAHVVIKGEIKREEDIDLLKDRVTYQEAIPGPKVHSGTAFTVAAQAYARYRAGKA